MNTTQGRFTLLVSVSHGTQHFMRRIFPPLIPIWVVSFDFSLTMAGILLGTQALGSAVGQAPCGILSDRYDRRYILPAGIGVIALSVGFFAVVPFLDGFSFDRSLAGVRLTGRTVAMFLGMFGVGIGSSVVHPTGYPLISENVADGRKGWALGVWGSAAKMGDGAAPAVVGFLLLVLAWPDILLLVSGVALVYTALLFLALGAYETRPASAIAQAGAEARERTDAAASNGAGGRRSNDMWADRRIYLLPMLAIFAFFAIRMVAAGGVNVFIPEFITSESCYSFGLGPVEFTPESTASFYYSVLLLTAGVVQLLTGRLVDRFDARSVVIGMVLVASVVLTVLAFASLSPGLLFAVLLCLGGSMWALSPARDAIISDISPAEREGRTFGYLWTSALFVSAVSPVIIGYIGDTASLRAAFAVLAATTMLSAVPIALLYSDRVYLDVDDS